MSENLVEWYGGHDHTRSLHVATCISYLNTKISEEHENIADAKSRYIPELELVYFGAVSLLFFHPSVHVFS